VMKQICEYEWVGEGEGRVWTPVEGSCVEKPFEECGDVTKFDEQIVETEVCREMPIEDCHLETLEVCDEGATREVCEEEPTETCEILPHEECREVTEKVPQSVSRKVAQLVCEDNEISDDIEEEEDDLKTKIGNVTISEIFGINEIVDESETVSQDDQSTEDEIESNVGIDYNDIVDLRTDENVETTTFLVYEDENVETTTFPVYEDENVETTTFPVYETTDELTSEDSTTEDFETESSETTTIITITSTTTSTSSTTTETTTTTITTSTTSSSSTTTESVETSSTNNNSPSSSTESSEQTAGTKVNESLDGSRIVFSDDVLDKRNEILATRRNIFQQKRTTVAHANKEDDHSSRIFFPDS